MLSLGPLAILNPAILAAFVILPAVWLLVRALPPKAQKIAFPPILLLRGLSPDDSTPDRTPWWVLALRLLMLALVILGLARPVLNPGDAFQGSGPILVAVDNGWEAASRWTERSRAIAEILGKAQRENRPVILLPTALPEDAVPELTSAREALSGLPALQPKPWSPDHRQAENRMGGFSGPAPSQVIWLSDGLKHDGTEEFHEFLAAIAALDIRTDTAANHAMALRPLRFTGLDIEIRAVRPQRSFQKGIMVEALGHRSQRLGEVRLEFAENESEAGGTIRLPQSVRNEIALVRIEGHPSAGATIALDWRAGRPLVGITEDRGLDTAPPLTSAAFYLSRALEPFSALVRGDIALLLEQEATVIFMADYDGLTPGQEG